MQNTTANQMLTNVQAAEMLSVRPQTLALWRSTKRQPQPAYVKVGGRLIRYKRADLEKFIEQQTIGSADKA